MLPYRVGGNRAIRNGQQPKYNPDIFFYDRHGFLCSGSKPVLLSDAASPRPYRNDKQFFDVRFTVKCSEVQPWSSEHFLHSGGEMKCNLFVGFLLGSAVFFTGCGKHGESVENVYAPGPVTLDDFREESGMVESAGSLRDQRICRTADLVLEVESYDAALLKLSSLLDSVDGFISASSRSSAEGGKGISGVVDLRCPNAEFEGALVRIRALGVVRFEKIRSEDMSAEWRDNAARLTTQKQLESRLLQLLGTRTGKLEEVLEVEEKLAGVRTAIERIERSQHQLEEQTMLATLSVKFEEQGTAGDGPSVWEDSLHTGMERFIGIAAWILQWSIVLGPVFLLLVPLVVLMRRKLRSRNRDAHVDDTGRVS